ncbi:MAG: Na/Pi cotransporter family protein [Lachnospiraceae bacterium]|jgi:phosphate:Na+ symporter|nr:Na/Pi cotransporter family protein [Lachnospiraceae bacterium]
MAVSDISNLFEFAGGLGMFLYGMDTMADGMQKTAGKRMNQFLGMLTNNRLVAVLVGALITAIIQSSGATTVMVVGFVSAGIMSLSQAVGVIMGANIGTTMTAWIVSLGSFGDAFTFMKPGFYAPLLIGIGAMMVLFTTKQKTKIIGEIFVGLGLLFMGLELMGDAIGAYTDYPIFRDAFVALGRNPVLGFIIGVVVTAVLQSSSASVGILQTLAMNGVVTTGAALYITLGQNIGSCVTAILSSAGGSRTAKRAAAIHLSFNVIGSIIYAVILTVFFALRPDVADGNINAVEISIFHTFFNLSNTLILFPFANRLVALSGLVVRKGRTGGAGADDEDGAGDDDASGDYDVSTALKHLDKRIFESPAFAVETAAMEAVHMGQIAVGNAKRAMDAVLSGDKGEIEKVIRVEDTINKMENMITEYLVQISGLSLTQRQAQLVSDLFYTVSDMERVGDHAENIAEAAQYMVDHGLEFSDTGRDDYKLMCDLVLESLEGAVEARRTGNLDFLRKVNQLEDEVDTMEEELREKHIERLARGECVPSAGVVFLDLLSNMERLSDHAQNIAGYLKNEI